MERTRKKYAVFTMDVESFTDTECVSNSGVNVKIDMLDGLDEYIKILEKYNIKATMFTVGKTVSKVKSQLSRYISNGHKIALHSYNHKAPMLMSNEHFKEETQSAKAFLEKTFNTEIKGYRAPCFSIDNAKIEILRKLGFKYDSSYLNCPQARHTVKVDLTKFRQMLKGAFHKKGFYEFCMSYENLFGHNFPISGGGYVRMAHWGVVKAAINHYIKNNDYYVFYLHPFELSRQKMPHINNLKFYDKLYLKMGIKSYPEKIEAIIKMLIKNGYTFVTFDELAEIMDKK